MKKSVFTTLLILGLLAVIVAIAFVLVWVFVYDVLYWTDGILSLLAFVVAAFIIGYAINRTIERVKRLWE